MQKTMMQKPTKRVRRTATRHLPSQQVGVMKAQQAPALKISRLENDVTLAAPKGCSASVLLKLVDRDDHHRYYSWWAMVGRHDMDTMSIAYKFTGQETIRVDLPQGMPLSAELLQPHLTQFLENLGEEPGPTPIIID